MEFKENDKDVANIKIQEAKKEANYQEIDKTQRQVILKATCVVDLVKYACDYQEIRFASTLMFAIRSLQFPLVNACTIAMLYKFKICSATTGRLYTGPYNVSPETV